LKQIINLYWKDTDNIGDKKGGIDTYFGFPIPIKSVDIKNINVSKEELAESFIILGGGGHIHLPSVNYNKGVFSSLNDVLSLSKWTVVWGIGNNIYGTNSPVFPECLNKALLVGLRDWENPYDFVPGPSCMSYLFNKNREYSSSVPAVAFLHKNRKLRFDHLPTRYTEGISFEESIEFLDRARVIYTNSYHGMYWGYLLNKVVIVSDRYSSKFYTLQPDLTDIKMKELLNKYAVDNYLDLCRKSNIKFFKRVLNEVYRYMGYLVF